MPNTTLVIRSRDEKEAACKLIEHRSKFPFTVKITDGAPRSLKQNRLYRKWLGELAEQGDLTAARYNGYCKLHFGVAIMKVADADYADYYDEFIKNIYSYEQKIDIMSGDYGWPVTSLMDTKQFKEFLDTVHEHFTTQGFSLTDPEDMQRRY